MPWNWITARKKMELFKDTIINNPIAMQYKLENKNANDTHHKWEHY